MSEAKNQYSAPGHDEFGLLVALVAQCDRLGDGVLDHGALEFLHAVTKGFSITQLYAHLGLSGRKGHALRARLEREGLIVIEERRGARGWRKMVELTPKGRASIEQ